MADACQRRVGGALGVSGIPRWPDRAQAAPRLTTGHRRHYVARGAVVTRAERAVLATSQARDLCLSLKRAFVGPRALERLRMGEAAALSPDLLRIALGLAWVARDYSLMRAALARLPGDRVADDP